MKLKEKNYIKMRHPLGKIQEKNYINQVNIFIEKRTYLTKKILSYFLLLIPDCVKKKKKMFSTNTQEKQKRKEL